MRLLSALQTLSPQAYGSQSFGASAGQLPFPSQRASEAALFATHAASRSQLIRMEHVEMPGLGVAGGGSVTKGTSFRLLRRGACDVEVANAA